MKKVILISFLLVFIFLTGCTSYEKEYEPSIKIDDQEIKNSYIHVNNVLSNEDGWLVLHNSKGSNEIGDIIGFEKIEKGNNSNINIFVRDKKEVTDIMYIIVYEDNINQGHFDYPIADYPIKNNNQYIMKHFQIKNKYENTNYEYLIPTRKNDNNIITAEMSYIKPISK